MVGCSTWKGEEEASMLKTSLCASISTKEKVLWGWPHPLSEKGTGKSSSCQQHSSKKFHCFTKTLNNISWMGKNGWHFCSITPDSHLLTSAKQSLWGLKVGFRRSFPRNPQQDNRAHPKQSRVDQIWFVLHHKLSIFKWWGTWGIICRSPSPLLSSNDPHIYNTHSGKVLWEISIQHSVSRCIQIKILSVDLGSRQWYPEVSQCLQPVLLCPEWQTVPRQVVVPHYLCRYPFLMQMVGICPCVPPGAGLSQGDNWHQGVCAASVPLLY